MIHDAGLGMKFWGEAALHAAYLTNVTGGKANDSTTPYEIVLKRKPSLETMRISGCTAYVHEPKEKRKFKLSTRGTPGILLGHEQGMYRVWNTQSNSLIVSKHVVTDETIFPLKRQVNKESKSTDDCIDLNKPNELTNDYNDCLLYTSPSPRDLSTSRMPSSA